MRLCANPECKHPIGDRFLSLRGGILENRGDEHRYLTFKDVKEMFFCQEFCLLKWIGYRQEEVGWIASYIRPPEL